MKTFAYSLLVVAVLLASPTHALTQVRVNAPTWIASREWAVHLDSDRPDMALAMTAAVDSAHTIAIPIITSGRIVIIGPHGDIASVLQGFGRISAVGFLGDTLWAADGSELRFGLFVRTEWGWRGVGTRSYAAMFGPSYVEGDTTRSHWVPVGLAPHMRVVARVEASVASRTVQAPRDRALVLLRSPTTGRVDTLAQLETSRAWMLTDAFGGAQRRTINPFRYGDLVAMDGSGQRIVVVNLPRADDTAHDDDSLKVSSWQSDGSVVFKRSYAVGVSTITTAALDSLARSLRVVDRRGYPVQGAAPSESFALGLRNANPQGSMRAPIDRLVVGRDGTIWLREEAAGGRGWLVLSSHGVPIGRVRFPENRRGVLLAADSRFVWMLEPLGVGQFQVAKYRMASIIPADGSP